MPDGLVKVARGFCDLFHTSMEGFETHPQLCLTFLMSPYPIYYAKEDPAPFIMPRSTLTGLMLIRNGPIALIAVVYCDA